MFKETVKKNPGSAPLVYSEPRRILHSCVVEICSIVFVKSCCQTNQATKKQMQVKT